MGLLTKFYEISNSVIIRMIGKNYKDATWLTTIVAGLGWLVIMGMGKGGGIANQIAYLAYLPLLWGSILFYVLFGLTVTPARKGHPYHVVAMLFWVFIGWVIPYFLSVLLLSLLTKILAFLFVGFGIQYPLLSGGDVVSVSLGTTILAAIFLGIFLVAKAVCNKKTNVEKGTK